ncbi:MAG: hypothetical protein IKP66_06620 [Lachnospiraceae bacterium]|nr:hypothetical protein [Lachnospiraceae bacterium]
MPDEINIKRLIEWGRSYDDVALDFFQSLNQFILGYYGIMNYSDNIKDAIKKSTNCNKTLEEECEKFDKQFNLDKLSDLILHLEKIQALLVANWINPYVFEKLIEHSIDKYGFTRKSAKNDDYKSMYARLKKFILNNNLSDKFNKVHEKDPYAKQMFEELE